jgi:hypothetical protein
VVSLARVAGARTVSASGRDRAPSIPAAGRNGQAPAKQGSARRFWFVPYFLWQSAHLTGAFFPVAFSDLWQSTQVPDCADGL